MSERTEEEEDAIAILCNATRASKGSSPGRVTKPQSKRWRIPPNGTHLLECVYAQTPCPSGETRDALAQQLGATPRQVQVWFQNKRQRALKRDQSKGDGHHSPNLGGGVGRVKMESMPMVDPTPSQTQALGSGAMAHPQQPSAIPVVNGGYVAQQHDQRAQQPQHYYQPQQQQTHPQVPQPTQDQQQLQMMMVSSQQAARLPSGLPNPMYVPPNLPAAMMRQPVKQNGPQDPPAVANTQAAPHPLAAAPEASVAAARMRRNGTVDSLADLAEVAECVDSIEHLAGGLDRVNSLKDLASDLTSLHGRMEEGAAAGRVPLPLPESLSRVSSLADLGSVSRVGSLANIANFVANQSPASMRPPSASMGPPATEPQRAVGGGIGA